MIDAVNAFKEIENKIIFSYEHWTSKEEDMLKGNWFKGREYVQNLFPQREWNSIKGKAHKMGLVKKKNNKWCNEDKMLLKENYSTLSVKEIAKRLNRTELSVLNMACRLKISNTSWSDEEIEILKKYYLLEGTKVVKRLSNKTTKQCENKARRLGLKYIGNKTSKYKYVIWDKRRNKWLVIFYINRKKLYFGSFTDEDEAGKVALQKAKEYGKAI